MTDLTAEHFQALTGLEVNDRSANPFNLSIFNTLLQLAKARLNLMLAGMPVDPLTFNYFLSLLIAHLWTMRTSDPTLKSESIGNYSYTRDTSKTKYLMDLEMAIASMSGGGAGIVDIDFSHRDDEVIF